LSDERLRELLEVQAYFGLPSPALVEKDFYVVKALAAIAAINPAPLRLVFGGGTALSRAHRLVRRMSEDIDLRIVGDRPPGQGSAAPPARCDHASAAERGVQIRSGRRGL
jgi:Nucleotidyl transferase AbiEii toxin, Type IV TA system